MAEPTRVQRSGFDEVVSTCVGLTRGQLEGSIAREPEISFDALLKQNGAGSTCTACMLDLEYLFSVCPRGGGQRVARDTFAPAARGPLGRMLKDRIYGFLDRCSPLVPYHLSNPMPVLAGFGIEEFVCVANDSLLYEGEIAAPPTTVGLSVRDAGGVVRYQGRHRIEPEATLRFEVSRFIAPVTGGETGLPAMGSVEISRVADRPGTRGTTRPQITINAADGCCAVHSQAAGPGNVPRWFTCLYRPRDERCFISIMNASDKPLKGAMSYPLGVEGVEAKAHPIALPPHGTGLHEITLDPEEAARLGGAPLTFKTLHDRPNKAHILCASPDLRRFSIDHI